MISCCMLVTLLFAGCVLGTQDDATDARFLKIEQEVNRLQQSLAVLQNKIDTQNDVTESMPVAFTASLSNTIPNLGSHQQIVFDHVITNVGNGYSTSHGHFTAPIRGVYVFFVVITNIPGHSSSVQLLKNGAMISQALAHGGSQNNQLHVTSTTTATVTLEQGDEVWVQNEGIYSTVEELDGYYWSSFSGHLIDTM